jgi:hypothetical protein
MDTIFKREALNVSPYEQAVDRRNFLFFVSQSKPSVAELCSA